MIYKQIDICHFQHLVSSLIFVVTFSHTQMNVCVKTHIHVFVMFQIFERITFTDWKGLYMSHNGRVGMYGE